MAETKILAFDWADPFGLDAQLSDEERLVRDTAEGMRCKSGARRPGEIRVEFRQNKSMF